MNCAPITVTGGKSKRSEGNETLVVATRDELPELFVANLADINSCKTTPSTDPEFPNPGSNVIKPGLSSSFAKVEGTGCVPKGATEKGGSGSGGSGDAGSGSPPAASSAAPAPSSAAAAPPAASSGFVTSVKPTSAPVASTSAAAVATSSSAAAVVAPPTASTPPSTGSSGPSGGLTGLCSSEGMFNCVGGTSYQQCASGGWSTMMEMPSGVKCAEGQTMTLWA